MPAISNPLNLPSDRPAELVDPVRLLVALAAPRQMRELGEDPYGLERYETPKGDAGLFGPTSMVWRVHSDLPTLLYGGRASLLLQSLHPRVMAGVVDHSVMADDLGPRLLRTARFVLWTSFGGTELAESLIEEVRRVHASVRGRTPKGERYSANDPNLLTFVHAAEVFELMHAYQRYSTRPLLRSEKDRYLEEMATVAERLGAREVPKTTESLRAYLRNAEGELEMTDGSRLALDLLARPGSRHPVELLTHRIVQSAGLDLLPPSAKALVGLREAPGEPLAVRAAALALAAVLRTGEGPAAVVEAARRRSAA